MRVTGTACPGLSRSIQFASLLAAAWPSIHSENSRGWLGSCIDVFLLSRTGCSPAGYGNWLRLAGRNRRLYLNIRFQRRHCVIATCRLESQSRSSVLGMALHQRLVPRVRQSHAAHQRQPHGLQSWIATQGQDQAMEADVQANHRGQSSSRQANSKSRRFSRNGNRSISSPRVIIAAMPTSRCLVAPSPWPVECSRPRRAPPVLRGLADLPLALR